MVLRWQVWSVLCLLVLTSVLAGCVGDDAPEPETSEDTGTGEGEGEGTGAGDAVDPPKASESKALTKVDAKSAIFAPAWTVGQSWTYAVSGSRVGEGYTATIGVVEDAGDIYVMGSDNPREFEEALIWRSPIFTNGIQKDSLAVLQGTDYQDLIGFKRGTGESWKVILFGSSVTLTKVGTTTITHGAGEATGIRVEGSGDGHTFALEYASDVEGITLFEWSDGDGTVLKYSLTAAQESGTAGLMVWVLTATENAYNGAGFSPVVTRTFASDGSGTHIFLIGEYGASRAGIGKVFDPDNEEVQSVGPVEDGRVRKVATVPDKAGDWRLVAGASGGSVDMKLFQIQVVTY